AGAQLQTTRLFRLESQVNAYGPSSHQDGRGIAYGRRYDIAFVQPSRPGRDFVRAPVRRSVGGRPLQWDVPKEAPTAPLICAVNVPGGTSGRDAACGSSGDTEQAARRIAATPASVRRRTLFMLSFIRSPSSTACLLNPVFRWRLHSAPG